MKTKILLLSTFSFMICNDMFCDQDFKPGEPADCFVVAKKVDDKPQPSRAASAKQKPSRAATPEKNKTPAAIAAGDAIEQPPVIEPANTAEQPPNSDDQDRNDKEKSANIGQNLQNDVAFVQELIDRGTKFERENQLNEAMRCYELLGTINKELAAKMIEALKIKIKEQERNRRHNEKIEALKTGAMNGNANDAFNLGEIYLKEERFDDALEMLDLASKNGHTEAAFLLASLYENGILISHDMAKAEKYYKIGAENGHPQCCYVVAKMFDMRAENYPAEASGLLQKSFEYKIFAADKGNAMAAAEVGYIYSQQNDHLKAKKYFMIAKNTAQQSDQLKVSLWKIMDYNICAEDSMLMKNDGTGNVG